MTIGLDRFQALFKDNLLNGSEEIKAHLAGGGPFLGVYGHAYVARLAEVMGEDFPAVHTLLGDDEFSAAAEAYIHAHPSVTRSVRWLGRHFSSWLKETAPYADLPVVSDMAAFEWGLGLAFDAPDAPSLNADDLAQVPPEAWPLLTFDFHPAFSAVLLTHDVAPFQGTVARDEDPEAAPEPFSEPQVCAFWRDAESLTVHYRLVPGDEALGLECLRSGGDFQSLCERLADAGAEDDAAMRAAGHLKNWIDAGWIAGLDAPGMSW